MTIVYLPDPTIFPEGSGASDTYIWLELIPLKISTVGHQTSTRITTTPVPNVNTYRLLLPRDFNETMNHQWVPMANTSMKIAEKASGIEQSIEQGNARFRVDTPLAYSTSENRSFTLMFNLVFSGNRYNTPIEEVINPIRDLQSWAAPQKTREIYSPVEPIELPYVFNIRTVSGNGQILNIFNVRTAALTSVQPTYKSPFINGYPAYAELSLSFTDIEPYYKTSVNRNITVT